MNRSLKLSAILLAAGPSSRLGQPKQLVVYDGETLVRRSARLLSVLLDDPLVAVTGYEASKVAAQCEDLAVNCVFNPEWEKGMGGSIARGARYVSNVTDGILVAVCDQWRLSRPDLDRLVESWRAAPKRIHAANWQEGAAYVSGPPVIFPARFRGDLKGLDKSRGARQLIDRHMEIVEFVELESAAMDLDRPEDLRVLEDEQATAKER